MSASLRKRRLALFDRGNDKCPICLTLFTKRDVELGKATLEHVPPKAFGVDSIAMCLTCKACNNSASRVEQAAAAAQQDEQKLQITIPRLVDEKGKPLFHTGYGTISGKNSMLLRTDHLGRGSPQAAEHGKHVTPEIAVAGLVIAALLLLGWARADPTAP